MIAERRKIAILGQLLVDLNIITQEQLLEALNLQNKKYPNKKIGEILIESGYITPEQLNYALSIQFLYPYLELKNYKFDSEVVKLIPKEIVLKYKIVPLDRFGNIITIVMSNPFDTEAIETVEKLTNLKVRIFFATIQDIDHTLNLIYK